MTPGVSAITPATSLLDDHRSSAVDGDRNFREVLAAHRGETPGDQAVMENDRAASAREAAAAFVGVAFIQPLLAQLRETSMAAEPFAPTAAEKRFGPMMDALLSDRLMSASKFPLIEAVAQRLSGDIGTAAARYGRAIDA